MLRHAFASPKLAALARMLSIERCHAVGILEYLWYFTATQAPRGDIGRWTDEEIAAGVDWRGDPRALIAALLATRWLDACAGHRLLVHDWAEHCDQAVKRNPYVRRHGFAQRQTSVALVSDASVTCGAQDSQSQYPEPVPEPEPDSDPASRAMPSPRKTGKRRRRTAKAAAPDDLAVEDKRALREWAERSEPWAVHRLRELVDDCLQWHRAEGKSRASWIITCQRWITNARTKYGHDKGPSVGRKQRVTAIDASRAIALELGLVEGGSSGASSANGEAVLVISAGGESGPQGGAARVHRRDARDPGADFDACAGSPDEAS